MPMAFPYTTLFRSSPLPWSTGTVVVNTAVAVQVVSAGAKRRKVTVPAVVGATRPPRWAVSELGVPTGAVGVALVDRVAVVAAVMTLDSLASLQVVVTGALLASPE